MSSLVPSQILGVAGPVVLIGAGAGLAAWWLEDAVKSQINSKPWFFPVVASLAGMGAGYVLGPKLGFRVVA
jgi:hypothetical protein